MNDDSWFIPAFFLMLTLSAALVVALSSMLF
jgi:hypothetical protein